MTERERALLGLRFVEIETELMWLAEGRVVEGDPAEAEEMLLEEQEEFEFRLGMDDSEQRNQDHLS
ncbi:MAG: hypothetical protein H0T51_25655 [Pirellulales bacterium]|nr:hypothetical protein [Pirellulales bacterium]